MRTQADTALDRLRASGIEPPYCYLLLDLQSVQCLAAGVVNARAQVAATKVLNTLLEGAAKKESA